MSKSLLHICCMDVIPHKYTLKCISFSVMKKSSFIFHPQRAIAAVNLTSLLDVLNEIQIKKLKINEI